MAALTVDQKITLLGFVLENGSENDRRDPIAKAKALAASLADPDWPEVPDRRGARTVKE